MTRRTCSTQTAPLQTSTLLLSAMLVGGCATAAPKAAIDDMTPQPGKVIVHGTVPDHFRVDLMASYIPRKFNSPECRIREGWQTGLPKAENKHFQAERAEGRYKIVLELHPKLLGDCEWTFSSAKVYTDNKPHHSPDSPTDWSGIITISGEWLINGVGAPRCPPKPVAPNCDEARSLKLINADRTPATIQCWKGAPKGREDHQGRFGCSELKDPDPLYKMGHLLTSETRDVEVNLVDIDEQH